MLFHIEIIHYFKIVQKHNRNQTIALKTHWSKLAPKLPAVADHKHNLFNLKTSFSRLDFIYISNRVLNQPTSNKLAFGCLLKIPRLMEYNHFQFITAKTIRSHCEPALNLQDVYILLFCFFF